MNRLLGIRKWWWGVPLAGGLAIASPGFAAHIDFPTERPALIFVLAGQSNAAGTAPVHELGPTPSDFEREDVLVLQDGDWEILQPGQNQPGFFGPELGLGATLADLFPSHQIGLVKHALPGTSLARDWNSTSGTGAALLGLVGKTLTANQLLNAAGVDFEFAGTFWVQGERDARNPADAVSYENNLRGLMAEIRGLTGADPFTLTRLSSGAAANILPFAEEINDAFDDVAGADPLAPLVNTDDIPLRPLPDGIHYTGEGYLALGERLARAHHSLLTVPEPSALAYAVLSFTALALFSRRAAGGRRRS